MYIRIRVSASAKKEQFLEKAPDQFIASVREPALMNRANDRVRQLAALHFGIPENAVRIISGHHSPSKIFSIEIKP